MIELMEQKKPFTRENLDKHMSDATGGPGGARSRKPPQMPAMRGVGWPDRHSSGWIHGRSFAFGPRWASGQRCHSAENVYGTQIALAELKKLQEECSARKRAAMIAS